MDGKKSIHGSLRWAKHVPSWTWQPPKLQPRNLYKLATILPSNENILEHQKLLTWISMYEYYHVFYINDEFLLTFPFPLDFPSCFLHLLGIPHRCCRWRCCDDGTANVRLDTTTGLWGKPLVCVASQAHRKPTEIIDIYKGFIMRFPISMSGC